SRGCARCARRDEGPLEQGVRFGHAVLRPRGDSPHLPRGAPDHGRSAVARARVAGAALAVGDAATAAVPPARRARPGLSGGSGCEAGCVPAAGPGGVERVARAPLLWFGPGLEMTRGLCEPFLELVRQRRGEARVATHDAP